MNRTKSWENFQRSVESPKVLIERCREYKTEQGNVCETTQDILKRSSVILLMTSWETYIEDVCLEIFNIQYKTLQGSLVGNYIKKQCTEQLKGFHNPDSAKVARLFNEFFSVNITEHWCWNSYNDPEQVRAKLNQWLKRRGEIVHRSNTSNNPSKEEIEKGIRFICELVNKTDEIIQIEILGI